MSKRYFLENIEDEMEAYGAEMREEGFDAGIEDCEEAIEVFDIANPGFERYGIDRSLKYFRRDVIEYVLTTLTVAKLLEKEDEARELLFDKKEKKND